MTETHTDTPAFTASNLALFGVLQYLASETDAANAWLRAACEFAPGPGTSAILTVTAYDARDRLTLQRSWPAVTDALAAHAGHRSDWASTTLTAHLADGTTAPEVTAGELADLVRRACDEVTRPGVARLDPSTLATLPGRADLLTRALVGARVLHAGSDRCGNYQMIAVSPDHTDALAELSSAVRDTSAAIFRAKLGTGLNNLSPVVADISTTTLALALAGHATPAAASTLRVGVITPGGEAAPQDVLSKIGGRPDLEATVTQVYLSDRTDLTRRVISAVSHLIEQDATAIVIGFGGGEHATLLRVHKAVVTAVDGINIPVYVGIGHHNFAELVPGAHVRNCTTPADAASLFIAEAREAPLKRVVALERSVREMASAGINADAHARATSKLDTELARIENDLDEQRRRHLQSPRAGTSH